MTILKSLSRLMIILTISVGANYTYAQTEARSMNVITTGVPFLNISPDARAGGMGDVGVASTPDVNSIFWNPAKYAFIESDAGLSTSYAPWLRNVADDMGLGTVSGFMKLDDRSAIGGSLRFFSLGNIQFTDERGENLGDFSPNELALDGCYSRQLSPHLSLAVAGRYIRSQLTGDNLPAEQQAVPASSYATDVALYYWKDLNLSDMDGRFSFGVNISNMGAKISYIESASTDEFKDFIPTNLRFGPSLTLDIDDYNSISFHFDVNKLLVPSPQLDKENAKYSEDVNVVTGIIQSFYDAPGGFNEELQEYNLAGGIEYWYDKMFAIRGGYFNEVAYKGDRKYFSLGTSLRYNVFNLDMSYLIPAGTTEHPLKGTVRFTLSFFFNDL
ncbi:MAG: type IX secretion system outer membrane channel protein PorV [Bacteroidales bacterium]|nr:type IX secretion system outer membrane channel protein PorV [Bacteroidales bacterium]